MEFSKEELEEAFSLLAESFDRETRFLESRGWIKTTENWEQDGFRTDSVWQHPKTGKLYAHISSLIGVWDRAYDCAITDYLYETGWKNIYELTTFESKLCKKEIWQRFIHPISKRVYSWSEAEMIAVMLDNDDNKIDDNALSMLTRRLCKLLEGKDIQENNLIVLRLELINSSNLESDHKLVGIYKTVDDYKNNN